MIGLIKVFYSSVHCVYVVSASCFGVKSFDDVSLFVCKLYF